MLVIDDNDQRIRLYLHEFKDEISLMATDGFKNTVLLRLNKIDHKAYIVKGVDTHMGFKICDDGSLWINVV